ncbi:MAG: hypothetical protein C0525_05325 [Flavobacterium sp.]|nr:hypothetical protein [Flavobacterium sp.]
MIYTNSSKKTTPNNKVVLPFKNRSEMSGFFVLGAKGSGFFGFSSLYLFHFIVTLSAVEGLFKKQKDFLFSLG